MANANSTTCNNPLTLIDAIDTLSAAEALAEFVQSIAITAPYNQSVTLTAPQLHGFGLAMQGVIDRVKDAAEIIDGLRREQRADNYRIGAMAGMDALRNIERIAEGTHRNGNIEDLSMAEYWKIKDMAIESIHHAAGKQNTFMTGFLTIIAEYIETIHEGDMPILDKWKPESTMTEAEKLTKRVQFNEEVEASAHAV